MPVRRLDQNRCGSLEGERPVSSENRAEVFAFEVLHHQVHRVVDASEVEHLNDVGMVELANGFGFEMETLDQLFVLGQLAMEQLHGRNFSHLGMGDFIDGAHATVTDEL